MTSSNAQVLNKKYIFLNNLENKLILLMKFDKFISYHLKNYKKFQENYDLRTSSKSFLSLQRIKHKLYWKMKLENESKLLILDMYLQNYQNLSN